MNRESSLGDSFPLPNSPTIKDSPLISAKTRKIDNNKLKLVCSMAVVNMSQSNLMEFAIEIIKKPPKTRISEEVSVLIKASENMNYFKELNKKNRHLRSNTHEKICSKIKYEHIKRGMTVMHYGDPAEKFYIILQGSVSIYVPRDFMVLQKEIEERKKSTQAGIITSVLGKIFQWRAKLKQFIREYPPEDSPINRKAFKILYAKASVELSPNMVNHLTKDMNINHDYYFYSSVIKIKRATTCNVGMPIDEALEQENEEEATLSPKNNEEDDLEADYSAKKAELEKENMNDFLKGFNENEKPILAKLQTYLGEVPLSYLDEPENYFQDGVFKFHLVGVFGPGNIFGEVGLLMRKPRSASVICNSDTDFAILTSEDYAEILEAVDRKEMESRMEFFIKNLFQELQPEVAIRLSYMFKKSKFMKGNFIYKQGEKANEVFLVKKGEIQIYTRIKESENEKKAETVNDFVKAMYHKNENKVKQDRFITIQLSNLGVGQSFGEEDIIYNRDRKYCAVCCSNKVTLFFIPKTHFLKIITENKKIQVKIVNNTKAKESWHRTQIENFFQKRQNKEETQNIGCQAEIFPIRRDIKEIPGLNSPNNNKKIGFHKSNLSQISSPLCRSPLNSISASRVSSPKNTINKSNLRNFESFFKFPKMAAVYNNVIRNENTSKASQPNLNSSIVEIVKKNDKNLEELLKYSGNDKNAPNNEFYKALNENELQTNKIARIMYLHKSKRRNYSNSDQLDSNQKISLKAIIKSFKKQQHTSIDETNHENPYFPSRKLSLDLINKINTIPEVSSKKITKTLEDLERKNSSPVANMLKVAFSNRGNVHINKKLNKKQSIVPFMKQEPYKTTREQTEIGQLLMEQLAFLSPVKSRQIIFGDAQLHKKKLTK